jgi:hypothetical protein
MARTDQQRRLVMDVGVLERKIIEVQTPSNGRFSLLALLVLLRVRGTNR